jgi:hypothetical protein
MAEGSSREEVNKVKVIIPLDDPETAGSFKDEAFWAEDLGGDQYRLLNSPFYAFGVSVDDVVTAKPAEGRLIFQGVAKRGGHSTYRLYLQNGRKIQDSQFNEFWKPISALGATFENANDHFVAVDIPPKVDIHRIYQLMQAGEDAGAWAFEEAHYGG